MIGTIPLVTRAACVIALSTAPVLTAAPALPAQAPSQAPSPAATLPAARSIIARYLEAVGGRDVILGVGSSRTTGTFELPAAGLIGEVEVLAAKPNKMRVRTTFPEIGTSEQGFDGETAWSVDAMQGPMLLEGRQREQIKLQADFYARLHDEAGFTSMETTDLANFEGRKVYKVHLVRTNGEAHDELFDAESGLLVGSIVTRDTPMGPVTVTSVMSDYEKFGDQLVPTKVVQTVNGQQIVITLESVEYDTVEPTAFELPEQIRALKR